MANTNVVCVTAEIKESNNVFFTKFELHETDSIRVLKTVLDVIVQMCDATNIDSSNVTLKIM